MPATRLAALISVIPSLAKAHQDMIWGRNVNVVCKPGTACVAPCMAADSAVQDQSYCEVPAGQI